MADGNVFGALRAASIASLCAGAGLVIAGCDEPTVKVATDATVKVKPVPTPDGEPSGASSCGADKHCSPADCAANKK